MNSMDKNRTKTIDNIFSKPDYWLAYINLGSETVIGKVKEKKGLIETIPHPKTNFRFNDIVEVEGPVGTSIFRDEQIPVFNLLGILHSSRLPTFSFDAILPTLEDWFDLSSAFGEKGKFMRFPYSNENPNESWQTGYCIASNIMEAESILEEFIISGKGRKVKNLYNVFENSQYIIPEVLGTKFTVEFKFPYSFRRGVTLVVLMPLALCVIVAIKIGSKSMFDLIGMIFSILILGIFVLYVYLYLKNWSLILNKDGLSMKTPFRRRRRVLWEDVVKVKYSAKNAGLLLEDHHKNRIKVSRTINNFRRFCLIAMNLIKTDINKNEFTRAL
jgi:hypothetical protein